VPGEIIVGIQSGITAEELFIRVNPYHLIIDQMNGFFYTTDIPADSVDYLNNFLDTKPYILTRQFGAQVWPHYETNILHNTTILFDMTLTNQADFLQTMENLRMADEHSTTKNILLKVPVGREVYWRDKFAGFSWVTWSDLNYIGQFTIH
jgi:hypothetical protein